MDIEFIITLLENAGKYTIISCGLLLGGFISLKILMYIVRKLNRWKALYATTAPVKEGKENGCRGQLKNLTCTVRGI